MKGHDAGAFAATAGAFAPTAVLAVIFTRMLSRIKNSPRLAGVLRGLRAAAAGLIFAAALTIGGSAAPQWTSFALFLISLVVLLRFRIDAVWIIPPAGLIGLLLY